MLNHYLGVHVIGKRCVTLHLYHVPHTTMFN